MKRKTCYICGKPITSEDSVSYGFKTGEISHLRCQLKSDGFDNSFLINGSLDFKNMNKFCQKCGKKLRSKRQDLCNKCKLMSSKTMPQEKIEDPTTEEPTETDDVSEESENEPVVE